MDAVSAGMSIRQKELVTRQLADPTTCALNVGTYCEVDGPLDPEHFRVAVERVVERFDALRTVLRAGEPEPVIALLDALTVPLEIADVPGLQHVRPWIAHDMQRPFEVYDAPLYRFALLRISSLKWVFYAGFHHMLVDGWAMGLVTQRVLSEYDAIEGGGTVQASYASAGLLYEAQARYAASAAFTQDADFWRERLSDHPGPLLRKVGSGRGGKQVVIPVCLSRTTLAALLARAGVGKGGEAPLLLAMLYGFFGRSVGRDDVVLGLSLLNRRGSDELNAVGLAVSAVPVRVRGGFGQDLAGVVREVSRELRSVYRHHRFPLGEMTRLHAQDRSDVEGLFDVSVSLLAKPYASLHLDNAVVGRQTQVFSSDAQVPLQVFVDAHDSEMPVYIDFVCDTAYFCASALERLRERFTAYAEALVTASSLDAATRIDAAERDLLVGKWNATAEVADFLPLHERVTRWAESHPQRVALVMGPQSLTYRELEHRIAGLAEQLAAHGVALESRVGVLLTRSIEVPIAMLAIQRTGGVYLPLDPDAPPDRLHHALADAGVGCLFTTHELAARFGSFHATLLYADEQADPPKARAQQFVGAAVAPANLAYVIYTSGTSGKPKGVGLSHGGLSNLAHALQRDFGIGADDIVLQFARASFDASIFEMAAAFANGAALHVVDTEASRSPAALAAVMVERNISMATLPPSLLPALSPYRFPALKTLVVAGEACSAETAAEWRGRCHLVNAYGPTETTVCATFGSVQADGTPPIGKPLLNTQSYVLDAALEPVPIGEPGTLYVGGDSLARGYLGRPGLSAERFIADPFGQPGGRLYCTGDSVLRHAGGDLEFLGRVDQQVKLRGFRIELGEIEAALRTCADIADAAVTTHRHPSGESTLVAYCVARNDHLPVASLRGQLATTLPDYMVPAQFVKLAALPLNANGKVDRNALVHPGTTVIADSGAVGRSGSIEGEIQAIWIELLNLPHVGIDQPFFEVGGSSLLLGQVLHAVEARLGVKLEIIDLIKHSTIRSLANHVHGLKQGAAAGVSAAGVKSRRARGGLATALGLRK